MKITRYVDLFSGIGSFYMAMVSLGVECVYSCEVNQYKRTVCEINFKSLKPSASVSPPDQDYLLVSCNTNSLPIIKRMKPSIFMLELYPQSITLNTDGLLDKLADLRDLGYTIYTHMYATYFYGLPQNKIRVMVVGFLDDESYSKPFDFPKRQKLKMTMSDILGGTVDGDIGAAVRAGGRGSGVDPWDIYQVDGLEVKLNCDHLKLMQGFPVEFQLPFDETTNMKLMGGASPVAPLRAMAKKVLERAEHRSN